MPYVALPYTLYNVVQLPGQTPGLLGGAHDRFQVERDPSDPDFRIAGLDGTADLADRAGPAARPRRFRAARPGDTGRASTATGAATLLALARGAPPLRHREGTRARSATATAATASARACCSRGDWSRAASTSSRSSTARRNGQDANWDSHEKLFPRHRQLIPPADQALSALIEDLGQRGLLDSTLVVAMGEFGRTPKINGIAGRDHWPDCYTALLAGGGVAGGAVYGASDRIGAYPADRPGHARRPRRDDLLALRHRPRDRGRATRPAARSA